MIKQRITRILEEMSKGIYERDRELGLALLSAIAGESIFLLGKPGVAKSLVARRLKAAFSGSRCFEYLMSRFSTPDEIFGPVKISLLKDKDTYERQTEGYLPEADVVFLDEIWKAGPAIQNSLLTIINEKIFHNGNKDIRVPMKALISASNELPAEGEGLEALWDRFLVRLVVDGIQDREAFERMISDNAVSGDIAVSEPITDAEFRQWQQEIDKVAVPKNILDVIHAIRVQLAAYNAEKEVQEQIYISDRRWKKIVRLMRAAAFLNGQKEIAAAQCWLISDCLWNDLSQIEAVNTMVSDAIGRAGLPVSQLKGSIQAKIDDIEKSVKSYMCYTEMRSVPVFKTAFESKPIISGGEWLTLKVELSELKKLRESNEDSPVELKGVLASASDAGHLAKVLLKAYMKSSKILMINSIDFGEGEITWPSAKQQKDALSIFRGVNYVRTTEETVEVEMSRNAASAQASKWDKQIVKVEQKLQEGLAELEGFSDKELKDMSDTLFVTVGKIAPLIEAVKTSADDLRQMQVQLQRIRHTYENTSKQ
ncbi:MAG: AAA family ATPase [Muribaculaceae bacterium]|nr:AAA family ATPase [Muribaculaceae bacterium]